MGSRTINHLIEDESRRYFRSILPRFWVCRDKHDDYGIDCEVEIFDENGNATGSVFWVQLKGTGSDKENMIKNLFLKKEKLVQFQRYDIPVLIVRFSVVKQKIYYKWAGSIYYVHDSDSSNIKLNFLESEHWHTHTHQDITAYLARQQLIKHGKVRFPIKTYVHKVRLDKSEVPYANLLLVRRFIIERSDYFSYCNDAKDAILQLNVDIEQLFFCFTDLAFASIDLPLKRISDDEKDIIFKCFLLAFCCSLFELGKNDMGCKVFFDENLFPIAKRREERLMYLLPHLLHGEYFTETMTLLNQFLKEEHPDNNYIDLMLNVIFIVEKRIFDKNQLNLIKEFLLGFVEYSKKIDDNLSLAAAYYNLANHYRKLGDLQNTLTYYCAAKRYNSEYKNHGYFNYEIGAILYELKHFKFASFFCKRAIQLDPKILLAKAMLADCFMYMGDYGQALFLIDEFLNESYNKLEHLDEWHIKHLCFGALFYREYPKIQKRDSQQASLMIEKEDYLKAVGYDMLSACAWFNKGIEDCNSNNLEDAFLSFSMSAFLDPYDVNSWVYATIFALNAELNQIVFNIIRAAYFYHRQDFLTNMYEKIVSVGPDHKNHILELIELALPKDIEEPSSIRIYDSNNNYTTIDLNR